MISAPLLFTSIKTASMAIASAFAALLTTALAQTTAGPVVISIDQTIGYATLQPSVKVSPFVSEITSSFTPIAADLVCTDTSETLNLESAAKKFGGPPPYNRSHSCPSASSTFLGVEPANSTYVYHHQSDNYDTGPYAFTNSTTTMAGELMPIAIGTSASSLVSNGTLVSSSNSTARVSNGTLFSISNLTTLLSDQGSKKNSTGKVFPYGGFGDDYFFNLDGDDDEHTPGDKPNSQESKESNDQNKAEEVQGNAAVCAGIVMVSGLIVAAVVAVLL